MPAWGLFDKNDKLTASCRAPNKGAAIVIWRQHNIRNPQYKVNGVEVRRLPS